MEDSGIGIKEEEKDKLFKLFGKLKIKDSINQNGVGLGLTISKKLVEQLGGDIRVNSIDGVGTTFSLFIVVKVKHDSSLARSPKRDLLNASLDFIESGGSQKVHDDKLPN